MGNTPLVRGLEPAQIEQFIADGFLTDRRKPFRLRARGRGSGDSLAAHPDAIRTTRAPGPGRSSRHRHVHTCRHSSKPPVAPRLHTAVRSTGRCGPLAPVRRDGHVPGCFPSPHDPGDAGWHVDVSRHRPVRLLLVAREHPLEGARAAPAVPVLRRSPNATPPHASAPAPTPPSRDSSLPRERPV